MSLFNYKKKYGQNFLIDENIVKKIVNFPVKNKSLVIEIGCGDGKLTKYLCSKFDNVLGYEIDLELKDSLLFNLSSFSNCDIYFCDFLQRNILDDLSNYDYENLYVVANLPYYITTPILEKIISLKLNIEMIRVMVQKEVGDRFTASVGSKEYSSITVYLNYNFDVKKDFIVSRNCFYPKPNVDSMILSFYKKDKLFVSDLDKFYKLVYDSFRFKRKILKNNLKSYDFDVILDALKNHGFDSSVRAEQIPVDIFCDISNQI